MSESTLIQEQLQELLDQKRTLEKSLQEKQDQINSLNQKNYTHIEKLQTKDGELRACRERVGELNERLDSSQKILAMGNLATGISGRMDSSIAFLRGNISSIQHHFLALDQVLKKQSAFIDINKAKGRLLRSYVGQLQAITQGLNIPSLLRDIDMRIEESTDAMAVVSKTLADMNYFSPSRRGYFVKDDVQRSLEQALTMAQRDLVDTVEVRREYTEVPNIVCDTQRLQQALYNLIQNAAEAMPRGGILTLRLGNQNSMVWIDVADNGPGVAEHNREKVFNLFFSSKPTRGAGVGLYLVKQVVDEHGGSVRIEATEGQGCNFRILLPIDGSPR
ncbi:MAG: sensor histidine kinase [Cellvibrionales bacterium]|nr:ATP-binding protein [Porticoccaceae bacterium]